jgi:hypothetical protein
MIGALSMESMMPELNIRTIMRYWESWMGLMSVTIVGGGKKDPMALNLDSQD